MRIKIQHIVSAIICAIAVYPIIDLIQVMPFTDITPYTKYKEFMEPILNFIVDNFSWFVIACATYLVVLPLPEVMHYYQEKIRKRQYYFEYERWKDTPYIPPLLFYYMMCPPVSFSNRMDKQANSDFYPLLVRDFQNRVAIHGSFNRQDPQKRKSIFRVIGLNIIGKIIIFYIALGLILYYTLPDPNLIFEVYSQTNVKFLIPVLVYILGYTSVLCMAVGKTAPWGLMENKLKAYFQEKYLHHEPRILWVDVLPDTDAGFGIMEMWKRDCYRRIQVTYAIKGQPFPHNKDDIDWDNPSIPGNPFPEDLDMTWVPKAREQLQTSHEGWKEENESQAFEAMQNNKGKKKGQVIPFDKKMKY